MLHMDNCPHTKLTVINQSQQKLRCRHCHLTIDAVELAQSYCPECYETSGDKMFDFDAVASEDSNVMRYKCEDCGTLLEYE